MEEIDEILEIDNGAKYYLCDLHIHTPHDPEKYQDINITAVDIVKAAKEVEKANKPLEVIAITNHNTSRGIEEIKEVSRREGLFVFPGVEITTSGGAHIIILFDTNEDSNTVEHFLTKVDVPLEKRGTKEAISTKSTQEVINIDFEKPRISIAAHSNSTHGLFHDERGQQRINAYNEKNLLAVEISDFIPPKAIEKICAGKDPNYGPKKCAMINSSDARSLQEIGMRCTLIKMSHPSLEGLRQAFLDYESRVRLLDSIPSEDYPKIIGMMIEGDGFLSGTKIHFNPYLNCPIGGKGTGKSCIIELLRYAFELEARTEPTRERTKSLIDNVLKPGGKVTVFLEVDGQKYKLSRIFNGEPILVDEKGELIEVAPSSLFPIEIYGQGEILEVAEKYAFQLGILDTFIADKLKPLEEEKNNITGKLDTNKSELLSLNEQLKEGKQKIERLNLVEEKLKKYRELGFDEILNKRNIYNLEEGVINMILEKIGSVQEEVQDFKEIIPKIETFIDLPLEELINTELISGIVNECKKTFDQIEQDISKISSRLDRLNESIKERKERIWLPLFRSHEEEYAQKLVELQKAGYERPGEYVDLEKEKQILLVMKKEIGRMEKEKNNKMREREKLLDLLEKIRRNIFEKRKELVNVLNEKLTGRVKIDIHHADDRNAFYEHLKEIYYGSRISEDVYKLIKDLTPLGLVEEIMKLQANWSYYEDSDLKNMGVSEAYAKRMVNFFDLQGLLELQIFEIPDRPAIHLILDGKEKSIFDLSIGQKCTAIISLLLVESKHPLVIDQPEDSLDNKFVYEEIVRILRKSKEKRQFLIATHNANISVLGDAELILALEAKFDKGWVEMQGSIDTPRMKEKIEQILEGGKEAFDLRLAKYGF